MERARTEWLRSLGFDKAGANRESFQFVVKSVDIQYYAPARLDDELEVSANLIKLGGASMKLMQEVHRGDEKLCISEIELACVSGDKLKPVRIPSEMTEKINTIVWKGIISGRVPVYLVANSRRQFSSSSHNVDFGLAVCVAVSVPTHEHHQKQWVKETRGPREFVVHKKPW